MAAEILVLGRRTVLKKDGSAIGKLTSLQIGGEVSAVEADFNGAEFMHREPGVKSEGPVSGTCMLQSATAATHFALTGTKYPWIVEYTLTDDSKITASFTGYVASSNPSVGTGDFGTCDFSIACTSEIVWGTDS